jgi:hypothetical protein
MVSQSDLSQIHKMVRNEGEISFLRAAFAHGTVVSMRLYLGKDLQPLGS